jgi:hypothetical protein
MLYIWVEGDDDERFLSNVVKPAFLASYDDVKFVRYRQMPPKKVRAFLRTIKRIQKKQKAAEYIFVADVNREPCVSAKKQKLLNQYRELERDKILVVVKEIEAWFLAGLTQAACRQLDITYLSNTDGTTKEQFGDLRQNKYDSKVDFQQEILRLFDIETARKKNTSFDYFMRKFCKPHL